MNRLVTYRQASLRTVAILHTRRAPRTPAEIFALEHRFPLAATLLFLAGNVGSAVLMLL